jgi:hypothetical protein
MGRYSEGVLGGCLGEEGEKECGGGGVAIWLGGDFDSMEPKPWSMTVFSGVRGVRRIHGCIYM